MEKIKIDSLEGLELSEFEKELYQFAEDKNLKPVNGDSFMDEDGDIISEGEVIEMMEREEAEEWAALDEARRDSRTCSRTWG
tara:strand:- start:538 stop:783 length:246 start_codon:yes stop_codon:yes gene_type:complete